MEKNLERKIDREERETEKLSKIPLIYDSKLKSNDTQKKIKRKKHSLTQNYAQNDPTNLQIKGFSFCNFKDEFWNLRGEISLVFQRNLTFNHSLDVEMSLEEEESEGFND